MKNNKGFTLVELLAVVMILGAIMAMASLSYTSYLKRSRDKSFDLAVNSMEDAAQSALQDCETGASNDTDTGLPTGFCISHSGIPEVGETVTINLSELVNYHYIDQIMSPYNTKEKCTGRVQVRRSTVNASVDSSNFELVFPNTCLRCGNKVVGTGC